MDEWRERLAGIDDDYLVGISNKGIVKRAYKDMGETAAEIGALGEEAAVKVGAETVTVRFPLGESRCTCPSRSICRHVVQAILTLREACLKGGADAAGEGGEEPTAGTESTQDSQNDQSSPESRDSLKNHNSPESRDSLKNHNSPESRDSLNDQSTPENRDSQNDHNSPENRDSQNDQSSPENRDSVKNHNTPENRDSLKNQNTPEKQEIPVWREINAYPLEKLKKALGSRHLQALANQAASGIRPQIQESSVVTVHLPEQGMVVKLLSPLEYSTCTCHKKELCRHKAAAILWCRLAAGTLSREALQGEAADFSAYDLEEVRDAARQMEGFLEELMGTGLSRVSPEAADYLERLAVISHNARLSRFEGYFRALSDSYGRYFARKAAFCTEDLMEQLTRLYRRAQLLGRAAGQEAVGKLAGEFRADYLPVGNLDLIGIAMEHFQSQTGYEGETVYFLEENTKQWYTYTNARPVFYDDSKRRGYAGKGQSPQAAWGLNLSFEDLLKVRIHLTGAKCDGRSRLSSSQETKGDITGEAGLRLSDISEWYYRDFGTLFREQIWKQEREWLAEQGEQEGSAGRGMELVLVRPRSCAKAEFSEAQQRLTLPLYDGAGRELLVEVAYSRQESGTIRYLERISEKKLPCFLGKVYLRDGRLRMYPVDLLDLEESQDAHNAEENGQAKERGSGPQGNRGTDAGAGDRRAGEKKSAPEEHAAAEGPESMESAAAAMPVGHRPKFLVMEDMAEEALSLMADLCQSGFSTVHDSTLKGLQAAASLAAQYGMEHLSGLLSSLGEELTAGRHRMEQKNGPLAGIYTDINEYLYIMRQKNEYNRGVSYYT